MKEILNYSIHNFITFQIVREKRNDFVRDLNLPFSFFEIGTELASPDIVLNLGEFKRDNRNCYIVDHKYFIDNNYFYCNDSGGAGKWEMEIFNVEHGKTLINFDYKMLGPEAILSPDLLPQDIILRPLIEYKLSNKGYFLLHGAGICKNNYGYLLSGRGGSFKTSICMDLLRTSQFGFLGDDKIILSKNLDLFSCPTHINIFEYKKNNLQNETFRNSSGKLAASSFIKYIDFIRFLQDSDSNRFTNYSYIKKSSKLNALILITRTNKNNISVNKVTSNYASTKLALNNLGDIIKGHTFKVFDSGQYYYKYILAYSHIYPNNSLLAYWEDLRNELCSMLRSIPCYEIEINQSYDCDVLNTVQKLINSI